ncbi:hypothetical protein NC652_013047 [Populus alba x Populus x berolinensis]|nr:hypothetical protein NC652_013047 [Populus alba x Populus x berolinensis]
MRFTSSVKIEALSNISLAYQPLPSKQSSESWMVSRVLLRLKPLGYRENVLFEESPPSIMVTRNPNWSTEILWFGIENEEKDENGLPVSGDCKKTGLAVTPLSPVARGMIERMMILTWDFWFGSALSLSLILQPAPCSRCCSVYIEADGLVTGGTWKLTGGFELMEVDNGFFMVKFDLEEDRAKVISGGPWMVLDHCN